MDKKSKVYITFWRVYISYPRARNSKSLWCLKKAKDAAKEPLCDSTCHLCKTNVENVWLTVVLLCLHVTIYQWDMIWSRITKKLNQQKKSMSRNIYKNLLIVNTCRIKDTWGILPDLVIWNAIDKSCNIVKFWQY